MQRGAAGLPSGWNILEASFLRLQRQNSAADLLFAELQGDYHLPVNWLSIER